MEEAIVPRKRGRPRKTDVVNKPVDTTPKKRGRHPKNPVETTIDSVTGEPIKTELKSIIYTPSEHTLKQVHIIKTPIITKTFRGTPIKIVSISNITDNIAIYMAAIEAKGRTDYLTEVMSTSIIKPDIPETSEDYPAIENIKFYQLPEEKNILTEPQE